jgi:pyruvate-ferredoxin/flavodoxin oxidoreductase
MVEIGTQYPEQDNWDFMVSSVKSKQHLVDIKQNVKNSQFATPLFEFSGACSGCGETPYVKLVTQLFGDRMLIANATGCSSIYGGSAPATPYTVNEQGKGPAWANSLFEDNAEFGLGFAIANISLRNKIEKLMNEAIASENGDEATKDLFREWIANKDDAAKTQEIAAKLVPVLEAAKDKCSICSQIYDFKQYLIKRSIWIFGGDGWAYDIGFGGLDHVIASGEDVNILVLDTEVYSNTGGQSSKSTPVGAVAKFAAGGKHIRKKDLGMIATTYGYVYVAQVAMGANQGQCLKAFREAEEYKGPSLIIAYSPCISHGLRKGMGHAQDEEKAAVDCGYWHLWRYNPVLEEEGKNPFLMDSKAPDWSKFQGFLAGEVRYTSLQKSNPTQSEMLYKSALDNAQWRYSKYQRLAAESDFAPEPSGIV